MSKETTEGKRAPASEAPTSGKDPKQGRRKRTRKERLQERLGALGIDTKGLTQAQMEEHLRRIKNEGQDVPDLRAENRGIENLNKSPKVMEVREQHLFEEVEVVITERAGTTRVEKKSTLQAMLDTLRQEGLKNKNVAAIREYFDRTLGKAKQEVEYSGDMQAEEQRPPTKAEKAAAKAYLEALEDEDE